jgi:hypothetical protein
VNKKARLSEIAGWLQIRNVPLHLRSDIYEYYRTMHSLTEHGAETARKRPSLFSINVHAVL